MTKKLSGFTIVELVLSLCIIGFITIIIIPVFNVTIPNKNKIMFKKAYYAAERTMYDLVNDNELYPQSSNSNIIGLNNTEGTLSPRDLKFCLLFADKLNTVSSEDCRNTNVTTSTPSFETSDNIAWYIPKVENENEYKITVDVNSTKQPNCTYQINVCENPDRFEIFFDPDGKMYVKGTKEIEYLSVTDSLTKD